MCGISGFIDCSRQTSDSDLKRIVIQMTNAIQHRGPDDDGTWIDDQNGIALGFRRLSILDLSPTGRQPMVSADERYVIIYNGEVYNFGSLRTQLENLGHVFRGHSDTEVLLTAISQWGLETAVKKFNGMFAFALWDRQNKRLFLVRDRLGIKPLYYGWCDHIFFFASELKCMRQHPAFHPEIDRNALASYLRHNYIPAPFSIYKGISKLKQGTILEIDPYAPEKELVPKVYWSGREIAEYGFNHNFQGSEQEAVKELDQLLRESISLRMIADVPLGAFLSGGVDSSCIVALMQIQSNQPIDTFTIGFHETDYDEAVYAKAVAQHLGTKHTELYITPKETLDVIPKLPGLYDEPFADSSQIPTFLVSELARRYVTVSLSGDGGDELFSGYNRYYWGRKIWNSIGWMPYWGRKAVANGIESISPERWQSIANMFHPILPQPARQPLFGDKIQKLAEILAVDNSKEMYEGLVSHWKSPSQVVLNSNECPTVLTDRNQWANLPFMEQMMYMDLVSYLPDDILVKVDRASMGVSLEARVPFLDDHRVVEFAWQLPLSMKLNGRKSKWLLRQVLYQYVPKELIERPKMGFAVPIDSWLRGPLKDWAESLLDENRLRQESYFNPIPIRQKWTEHIRGDRNWQYYLWDILMFQAWLSEAK